MDDLELLREYVADASEEAFETLVRRHTDLVYSTALRQVRNAERAKEITQTVFILLARKASSIPNSVRLTGWLFRTTCFVAKDVMKADYRRIQREQKAVAAEEMTTAPQKLHSVWDQISPLLNELINQLSEVDRNALLLRFFEGKELKAVGQSLGISEEAAKKRVARAVEKLRIRFMKKGVVLTGATLAETLPLHVVQSAPVGLAASIFSNVAASGALLTLSSTSLLKGTLLMIGLAKLKTTLTVGTGIALSSAAIYLAKSNSDLRQELNNLQKTQGANVQANASAFHDLKPKADRIPFPVLNSGELLRLRNELQRLRELNDELIATNSEISNSRTQWVNRYANTKTYTEELQVLLDNIIKETNPAEYERIQQEMSVGPGDVVTLGPDVYKNVLGQSFPLTAIQDEESSSIAFDGALLNRYGGITNYEQLRMSGFTNFSIEKSAAQK